MLERGNMTDAEYIAALQKELMVQTKKAESADSINKKLMKKIEQTDSRIEKLEKENEMKSVKIACLEKDNHIYLEALILCKRKIFCSSSEKTQVVDQLNFFNEAETEYTEATEEPVSKEVKGYTRKNPKTRRDEIIKNIETEIIPCELPDEERICPRCGSEMKAAGKKYVREDVEYIPAKLVIRKYYSTTYVCKKCEKQNVPVFLHGFVPAPLLPHSLASASTAAWVMYQKYVNAMPLYRQEKEWERLGYSLSRATMANWIIQCSEYYLSEFINRLKTEMLNEGVIHCDETYVKVLKEKDVSSESKQYMWVYRNGKYSQHPVIIYDYNKSRSGDVPKEFLGEYTGFIHTDGYGGYNKLTKVTHINCWAHLRRKFHEAILVDEADVIAKTARDYCDKLFKIESELEHMTNEERYNERLTREKPVFEAFWSWAEKVSLTTMPKSKIGKAFEYAFKRREEFGNYFLDGRCAISNNIAENAIRPFTVGRKNWLFSDSPNGSRASANIYSIVETAKANGLDVFKYLELILTVLPNKKFISNPDIYNEILPWNDKVKKICALTKEADS